MPKNVGKKFEEFVEVVRKLQSPSGCPWDREQTHASLKPYMVEEVYEAMEAIDDKNYERLAEELGDMLLHILMHAEMGRRAKAFDIEKIISSISEKMIRRHPHVFKDKEKNKSIEKIWARWEKIKMEERAKKGEKRESILAGIPKSLPALYRAEKVQKRAARVGYDFHDKKNLKIKTKEEIGELLFSIANAARKMGIDPEEALHLKVNKFMRDFLEQSRQIAEPKENTKKDKKNPA